MVRAYVLIKIEPGKIDEVADAAARIGPRAQRADAVTGPTDVIALVKPPIPGTSPTSSSARSRPSRASKRPTPG